MLIYQIIIKNNLNTGYINYRKLLIEENIKLAPKKDTDGLSIFVKSKDLDIDYLTNKFEWILTILKCSPPIHIPERIKIRSRPIKSSGNPSNPYLNLL